MSKKLTCSQIIKKRKSLWDKYEDIQKDKDFVDKIAEYICREENKHIRKEIRNNPEYLIEMCFVIVDVNQKTVPLFANEVQQQFQKGLNKSIDDYKKGLRNSLKFIILKGRQQGFTTWITAYQLSKCIISKNFTGFTIADISDNSKTIFNDKAKYPYNQLPDVLKPTEKFNSRNELFFDKLNSSWRISTAESEDAGRSKTISFLHASETGCWKSIRNILAGLGQAITQDAIQIMETTAKGFNEFKEFWDDEENDWEKMFFEWWETPRYKLNFETKQHEMKFKAKVLKSNDDFFIKLKNLKMIKKLSWNQLYWYYGKKKDLGNMLFQEYPCTPQEAFLHTGRKYFDVEKLNTLAIFAEQNKIIEKRKDFIKIFNKPEPGERYVLGADVAEGLEGGDASHFKIFKLSTFEEVCFGHGQISPDNFGDMIVDIAKEYNDAFVGIERNNHGHSVLATIYRYRNYKNIYFETNVDNKKDLESKKLGWSTNAKTKYLMLDELDSAIREEIILIKDSDCIKELYSVVTDEKGNVELNGKDRAVATCVAYQMRKYYKNRAINFDIC